MLSDRTKQKRQKNIYAFWVIVNDLQLILWIVKEEAVQWMQPRLVRDRNAVANWIIVYRIGRTSFKSTLYLGSWLLFFIFYCSDRFFAEFREFQRY